MRDRQGRKQIIRDEKQIRPTSLGLPAELKTWLANEAYRQGVSRSRLAADALQMLRKHLRRQARKEEILGR